MNELPRLRPITIKERRSVLFLRYGQLDVIDGAFVLVDAEGVRVHIPVGATACIMLEPGTRVSHAAVVLAARAGTLLVWCGESGVRTYAAGQPGGARADRLLYQAKLALDDTARLKVVRKMYEIRFGEKPPAKRSVEQLRGIEGARVREMYKRIAARYGLKWERRRYDPSDWQRADPINRALSCATACLYGVTEAAVLAAGYAPAIGFIHTGKPLSFVYDIADLFKFETVVPAAFEVISKHRGGAPEPVVRARCRDLFRESKLLRRIIPLIEEVLAAGEVAPPEPALDAVQPAIPNPTGLGDAGHRH